MTTIAHARQAIDDAAARAELYRMWHIAQRMGATHVRSLEMMGPRDRSSTVETFRTRLLAGTQRGESIGDVVAENPKLVQPFEAALLRFGEASGSLEQSLATLVTHFKSEHRLLLKVWSKLTYPLFTSLAFIFITPLPLIFRGQAQAYLITVALGLAAWYGFGGSLIVALAHSYANRTEYVLARLARALAVAIEAGLPLDRVAVLAAQSTGHPAIIAHVQQNSARQLATRPLSEVFDGCPMVPFEMIAAIRVAEASSDFGGALRKLADLYET